MSLSVQHALLLSLEVGHVMACRRRHDSSAAACAEGGSQKSPKKVVEVSGGERDGG